MDDAPASVVSASSARGTANALGKKPLRLLLFPIEEKPPRAWGMLANISLFKLVSVQQRHNREGYPQYSHDAALDEKDVAQEYEPKGNSDYLDSSHVTRL